VHFVRRGNTELWKWVGTEIGGGKGRWLRRVDGEGEVAHQLQVQVAVPFCPLP